MTTERPDPARTLSAAELAALVARIDDRLTTIFMSKDDAESIRVGLHAVRAAIEAELWPHRENMQAVGACRQLWEEVAEAMFAYRHRARISAEDCRSLMQWRPAPWLRVGARRWARLGLRGLTQRCIDRWDRGVSLRAAL